MGPSNMYIAKMALKWNPEGIRRRGRPRMTGMRSTHEDYQGHYSWQKVRRMAQDRPCRAEFVFALCLIILNLYLLFFKI